MGPAFLIFIALAMLVVLRLIAGAMDSGRVRQYVESQGGEVLEKRRSPEGADWWGDREKRIYHVRYRDGQGNIHEATCRTRRVGGVYFAEDRIVERHGLPVEESQPPD